MSKRATKPKTAEAIPETGLQPLVGQRQKSESDAAVIACNDWLRLGVGRTIPKLLTQYQEKSGIIQIFKPPTDSYGSLSTWSSEYDWPARATTFDAEYEARKTAERQAAMDYGLALDYERVGKLKKLADFLEAQIYERGEDGLFHNIFQPDAKQIGGPFGERVDIERFNGALLAEYRATLDDIAKEVGGRVKKSEVSGPKGGAIPVIVTKMDMDEL